MNNLKKDEENFIVPNNSAVLFYLFSGFVYNQPIKWLAFKVFGDEGSKVSFEHVAFSTLKCTPILGIRYSFENRELVPKNAQLFFFPTIEVCWIPRELLGI